MRESLFQFPAANGEHSIHCTVWYPDQTAAYRGIVQISHGMQEHMGRYREFGEYLTRKGFIVAGNDHAGHGDSHNGIRGYFGASEGYQHMVKDMAALQKIVAARHSLPYFLLGHSMGSFLARLYAVQYGQTLKGLILTGTTNLPPLLTASLIQASKILSRIHGPKTPGKIVQNTLFQFYSKPFQKSNYGWSESWLTRDKEKVNAFMQDPKCRFYFTYSGFENLFSMIRDVSGRQWVQSFPVDLPLLFLSGQDDALAHFGQSPKIIGEQLKPHGCDHVSVHMYKGCRHEILNELNRYEIYNEILLWLERHRWQPL